MQKILVAGAGKIGALVAFFLANTGDYHVFLADVRNESVDLSKSASHPMLQSVVLDVTQIKAVTAFIKEHEIQTVIACLPFFHNIALAKMAREVGCHYFDLTEDIHVSESIKQLAIGAKTAFVPHCGLAPGFVNIVANDMIQHFESVESVLICAGALPASPHNALKYALTWSTEGLINEYVNPCLALMDGEKALLEPLEGLESVEIDGLLYEIFNTSGGLATLADSFQGKVTNMYYKTLRYPGHCEKIQFLLNDLNLKEDRPTLKRVLENAIPTTLQDVVVVYIAVKGYRNGEFLEETFVRKMYPQEVEGKKWSAIQMSTASGLCAILDHVLQKPMHYKGMILQESFSLKDMLNNRFGQYFSNQPN